MTIDAMLHKKHGTNFFSPILISEYLRRIPIIPIFGKSLVTFKQ